MKVNHRPANAFNTLFDEFLAGLPTSGNWKNNAVPPVNIHETKDGYHLELSAPGRNKEDFNIKIEKGLLTISFEKQESKQSEEYKTVRREFSFQSFSRSFHLDENVDAENIQAKYENGVLKLLVPKKDQPKDNTKVIAVQ